MHKTVTTSLGTSIRGFPGNNLYMHTSEPALIACHHAGCFDVDTRAWVYAERETTAPRQRVASVLHLPPWVVTVMYLGRYRPLQHVPRPKDHLRDIAHLCARVSLRPRVYLCLTTSADHRYHAARQACIVRTYIHTTVPLQRARQARRRQRGGTLKKKGGWQGGTPVRSILLALYVRVNLEQVQRQHSQSGHVSSARRAVTFLESVR
jgi:hypothetical protein